MYLVKYCLNKQDIAKFKRFQLYLVSVWDPNQHMPPLLLGLQALIIRVMYKVIKGQLRK